MLTEVFRSKVEGLSGDWRQLHNEKLLSVVSTSCKIAFE